MRLFLNRTSKRYGNAPDAGEQRELWARSVRSCPTEDRRTKMIQEFRKIFLKYLTKDSETHDSRRKDFNQALFNEEEGWMIYHGTDLDMIMEKFDKAVEEYGNKR